MFENKLVSKIAKRIYELFVVNPYAIAIQEKNGVYLTKYVQYDASVLEAMLHSRGSAGCYQQGFKNGLIKWVCFDYDCNDKITPNLQELLVYLKREILARLDRLKIHYLTEFSGRRGIHVWIIFDRVFEKRIGYQIVKKILEGTYLDTSKYGLDEFPATDSSKNNRVGKQVKFPLSYHQKGGQSFFFKHELDLNEPDSIDFLKKQYHFIRSYKENSLEVVCQKLDISLQNEKTSEKMVKKYRVLGGKELSVNDIVSALSDIRVYKDIFFRIKNGKPQSKDWFVILGTLGCFDKDGEILKSFFAQSAAYDEKTTQKNIDLWKGNYYPATLSYLYKLYNLTIEKNINPSETGAEIIAKKLSIPIAEIETKYKSEKNIVDSVEVTVNKEIKYLQINDENIVIGIWNDLKLFSSYECECVNKIVSDIKKGNPLSYEPQDCVVFKRRENLQKIRTLVSLSAFDRVLTTHVSLDLAYSLIKNKNERDEESFSYKVSFLSKQDIFCNWYTSWGNYIEKIKSYINMPFMSDWGVITVDISHFYDTIDFLTVYNLCKKDLEDSQKNEFTFLINYNEKLMRMVNEDKSRMGVPQGPAFARIISEIFLDKILSKIERNEISNDDYRLYRYVDDIIIFYKEDDDGQLLYDNVKELLAQNGLSLNEEKSRYYGKISKLSQEDINTILRKEKFNYMYQKSELNMLLSNDEKRIVFDENDGHSFRIDDAAFIFSVKTDDMYVENYYRRHAKDVFSSDIGRGSVFRKIYDYVFSNENVYDDFISKQYYRLIPLNSLNFKNFISLLYLRIQNKQMDKNAFYRVKKYLSCLNLNEIEKEECCVIKSLLEWSENYV